MKTYSKLIDIALNDEIMDLSLKSAVERKTDRPEVQEVIKLKEQLKDILRVKILKKELKPLIHKAHEINDGFKQKKRLIIQTKTAKGTDAPSILWDSNFTGIKQQSANQSFCVLVVLPGDYIRNCI